MKHPATKYFLISLAVIVVDQIVKMLVHYNMQMEARAKYRLSVSYSSFTTSQTREWLLV